MIEPMPDDRGPARRPPVHAAARMVGCALLAVAGAVLIAGGAIAEPANFGDAQAANSWGIILLVVGLLGFVFKYAMSWPKPRP